MSVRQGARAAVVLDEIVDAVVRHRIVAPSSCPTIPEAEIVPTNFQGRFRTETPRPHEMECWVIPDRSRRGRLPARHRTGRAGIRGSPGPLAWT